MRSRFARLLSVLAVASGLTLGSLSAATASAPSSAPEGFGSQGALAATWQASQLRDGHIPGFEPGHPDWGLTIDTAYMLAADGTHAAVLAQVKRAIAGHIHSYVYYAGSTSAGAMSKVLVAAAVLRADPADFGGINVRHRELTLVAPPSAGFEEGRLRDTGATDYSNVFSQSYGTIGLARTGGVPQSVVDYLVKQHCAQGYFRLEEVVGQTCDDSGSGPDVDATALALEALIAAKAAGATVGGPLLHSATQWLASVQNGNGSFAEDGTARGADSNTTGLAAVALKAAGRPAPRRRAAAWVSSLQITAHRAGHGPARRDIGAIAFDPAAFHDAIANGLGANRSQWWRSTPQAYFALVPIPLGTVTAP